METAMFRTGLGLAVVMLLQSCASAPPPTLLSPPLAFSDFVQDVLTPSAAQKSDEILSYAKARVALRYHEGARPAELWQIVASLSAAAGHPSTEVSIAAAATSNEQERAAAEARLEAARLPLQNKLLAIYTRRTIIGRGLYAVCIDGTLRRYRVDAAGFTRLDDDKNAGCPVVRIWETGS
jgi:hypothetical protein